jgi:ribonuclease VapC
LRKPNLIVLDSSAVLAVLRDEPGAENALEMMVGGVITAINLGEVAQVQFRDGFSRDVIERAIEELAIPVISVDAEIAFTAAEMRMTALAKGMSQADCICLALAKREGVPALTGDRKWLEIAETVGVEVRLIR